MLSALAVPNFFAARQRARDAQRKSDIKQIQKALELYKDDQATVAYPTQTMTNALGSCNTSWTGGGNTYMPKMPCDPVGPTPYYYVRTAGDSLKYTLRACLENPADPDKDTSDQCSDSTTYSYTLTEP